jgi:molybdenum cofactor biosynthesis protein MoaC
MVDVSEKSTTTRVATARGRIYIPQVAYDLIVPRTQSPPRSPTDHDHDSSKLFKAKEKARAKGDVLTVAQLAAIMASKRTSELIPLCHPVPLSHVSVSLEAEESDEHHTINGRPEYSVVCTATVRCSGQTGVEMEALTAVSVGLLTVWDMLKAVAGREMIIGDIYVSAKSGGKSGDFTRDLDQETTNEDEASDR